MKITNWSLSLDSNKNYFTNEKMLKVLYPNKTFDECEKHLFGQIESNYSLTSIRIKVSEMTSKVVRSARNNKYRLGKKSIAYKQFEEAVALEMPILYNWMIGIDALGNLVIDAVCFEGDTFYNINEKIIGEVTAERKLILDKTGETFIVWGAYSERQRLQLKENNELFKNIFLSRPIALKRYAEFFKEYVISDHLIFDNDHNGPIQKRLVINNYRKNN